MSSDAGTALKSSILDTDRDYHLTLRAIAASADVKRRFRIGAKVCSVPIIILLVIAALGPAKWVPRSEFGWQFDHMIGYFGITLFFCFAWPRPFVVGGIFMALAGLLEGLQAFTPDRTAYLPAVFYGAGGALTAALIVELLILGVRRRAQQLNLHRSPQFYRSAPALRIFSGAPSIARGSLHRH